MRTVDDIAAELFLEIEITLDLLKETPYKWREVEGAYNILKSKNKAHYQKIERKLFMDYRMIHDHQIDTPSLNERLDKSYTLAELLAETINQERTSAYHANQ